MNYPRRQHNSNEYSDSPRRERPGASQLTPQRIEEILSQHRSMLFSLKGDISAAFTDALAEKIRYENISLHAFLESEAEKSKAAESGSVLRSEYFVRKTLDTNLL